MVDTHTGGFEAATHIVVGYVDASLSQDAQGSSMNPSDLVCVQDGREHCNS
jgi:hypothetical protein